MSKESKILFPTEFGPLGEKAEENAAFLAKQYDAELVLLHVFHIPTGISKMFSSVSEDEMWKRSQAELDTYANKIKEKYGVAVATLVRHDKRPEVAIVEAAKEINAKLITFGTKGGSGLRDTLLGSAVNYVIRHTSCPVLTIRNQPKAASFKNIVVPMDLSQEAGEKISWGINLAKKFGGRLHIYSAVGESGEDQMRLEERVKWSKAYAAKQGFTDIKVSFEQTSKPVSEAILGFADRADADLVIVMTQQESESGLKPTVLGSVADQIVNSSQRPVLSIRPERHHYAKAWQAHHFT